ncbi:hypothetical protein ACMAZF_16350 [Psychrobium sp. nBUS_13]|uniref:hypothetical protein n=1 Tax=Psychrobium sp. nBUS_13 TaxID=3395319 RepID=UPI003EBF12D8
MNLFKVISERLLVLNYDICSLEWKFLNKLGVKSRFPPILTGLIRALYFSLKSLRDIYIHVPKDKVLFFVGSHNQVKALSKVHQKSENGVMLSIHNFRNMKCDSHIPLFWFYFMGWLVFPITVISIYAIPNEYQKWALKIRFERALISSCSVWVWKFLFMIWRPRTVIISNDHNHWTCAIVQATKELNIPSVYIPHAFTSETFPPLECTYSCLESDIQKNRYVNRNSDIRVVGAVRYEDNIKPISRQPLKGILVCFNELDSNDWVRDIIENLVRESNFQIFIKPHPADVSRHTFFEGISKEFHVDYVEPCSDISTLQDRVQILLGGITGAHIDALIYSMLPMTFENWYPEDYYGLLSDGALLKVKNASSISFEYSQNIEQIHKKRVQYNYHCKKPDLMPSDQIIKIINDIK